MTALTISLPNLVATEQFARKFAPLLRRGDVLALEGSLGAGKTTFARALLQALGVAGEVPSPTFTLLQTYDLHHFSAYHFDLYRLKNESELEELGWDEALVDGLALIEWPERAGDRMPRDALVLRFSKAQGDARQCEIGAPAAWIERLKGFAL